MKMTLRQLVLTSLALVVVAGVSYGMGLAQGKQAVNTAAGAIKWAPYAPGTTLQVAALWGDRTKPGEYGMLLKMPAGFDSGMHSHTADYHGLGIQGTWLHTNAGGQAHELPPGSYAFQPGKLNHSDQCKSATECIILVHQHAAGDFIPAK